MKCEKCGTEIPEKYGLDYRMQVMKECGCLYTIGREPTKKEVEDALESIIENANKERHEQYMENLRNIFRKTINPNSYTEQFLGLLQLRKQIEDNYGDDPHNLKELDK